MTTDSTTPAAKRQRTEGEDAAAGMDVDAPPTGTTPGPASTSGCRGGSVHHLMPAYYKRLFPTAEMVRWLSYGNDGKHAKADGEWLKKREFCFTLDGDIFVRYQSFKGVDDLRKALMAKCPSKIDIGPVYNEDPSKRALYASFHPVERELVFDIDLTDYDDVRTCGDGAHVCGRCWPLMAVAIQLLDTALREDFGFRHVLWVFSGRRGVHAWVCDARARRMTDEQRSAVAAYLGVYKGVEEGVAKLGVSNVQHPAVARAYATLLEAFEGSVLREQALLAEPRTRADVLKYVPDEALRHRLGARWAQQATTDMEPGTLSLNRWGELRDELEAAARAARTDKIASRRLLKAKEDIVLAYTYPRLDIEVSKKMNHLLKAPFCVHPKTGKVCVPIDPATAHEFDPDAVPTVRGLLSELERVAPEDMPKDAAESWRATSLKGVMATFDRTFWSALAADSRKEMAARGREGAAALAW